MPNSINWSLTVLGSGPLTKRWQERSVQLGVAEHVTWTGRVGRDVAIARMSASHVMVVTSVYDLTSSVIIEALSVGLPVICPDHYGFRDAIDESCGLKVATTSLADISRGIANAIERLHDDEAGRQRLASSALERANHYSWKETGRLVSRIYEAQVG